MPVKIKFEATLVNKLVIWADDADEALGTASDVNGDLVEVICRNRRILDSSQSVVLAEDQTRTEEDDEDYEDD